MESKSVSGRRRRYTQPLVLAFVEPNDWQKHYELRNEIRAYCATALRHLEMTERVRFDTEVLEAVYDERTSEWRLTIRTPEGGIEEARVDVLVSAVGVLNRPKRPQIRGADRFAGESFHSAEWPDAVKLAGKRVAVVGTGASAMQIGPAIVGEVAHLSIFQRTPPWVAPFPKFHQPISEAHRMLLRAFPVYRSWYWLRLFWLFGDRVIGDLRIDPDWPHPSRSINARNESHRRFFTRYISSQLAGRDDLISDATPSYPPFGKRMLLDNGWYPTLTRPNVTLVPHSVTAMDETGLVDALGRHHEVDVVIWATGFQATRFVSSMHVYGRQRTSLRDVWSDDDPTAYLGVSVPSFPNLFLLGGPNSFPGSGSFMYVIELQMRYIARLLLALASAGGRTLEVREEVCRQYNEAVQREHARSIWTHPGMTTYYPMPAAASYSLCRFSTSITGIEPGTLT